MTETRTVLSSSLGLPGETPTVRAFEQESKVVYHEVGGFEPGKQPGEEGKGKK